MLVKTGPWLKRKRRRPVSRILLEDVGAGDVGRHQVRRELDALGLQVQRLGQRPHQQGLAQPRRPDQQAVALREEGHQHLIDNRLLADNGAPDLLQELFP
jgi:hypothetical protein